MSTVTIEMQDELADLLATENQPVAQTVHEVVVLDIYRRGVISQGKGAALLNLSRLEFIQLAGRHQIPFTNITVAELEREMADLEQLRCSPPSSATPAR